MNNPYNAVIKELNSVWKVPPERTSTPAVETVMSTITDHPTPSASYSKGSNAFPRNRLYPRTTSAREPPPEAVEKSLPEEPTKYSSVPVSDESAPSTEIPPQSSSMFSVSELSSAFAKTAVASAVTYAAKFITEYVAETVDSWIESAEDAQTDAEDWVNKWLPIWDNLRNMYQGEDQKNEDSG